MKTKKTFLFLAALLALAAALSLRLTRQPPAALAPPAAVSYQRLAAAVHGELQPAAPADANAVCVAATENTLASAVASASALSPRRVSAGEVFPGFAATTDWRAAAPERITVAPHPDLPMEFTRERVRTDGARTTWTGRTALLPGASLVTVADGRALDAWLVVPGASEFAFHVEGGVATVLETNPGAEHCANDAAPSSEVGSPVSLTSAGLYEPTLVARADAAALSDAPLPVDVLFLYDATAATYVQGIATDVAAYLEARARAQLETANGFLRASGVTNVEWRFAGLLAAPAFVRDGKFLTDVNALSPGGAIFSWVREQRYRYGADQIVLLVGTAEGIGGRAATRYNDGSHRTEANEADWASLVVNVRAGAFTFAHEAAHNWGCWHDRANFFGTNLPTPDGDGLWCYGLRFLDNQGGITGTIMAYSDYKVPYFSNPELSVRVTTTLEGRAGSEIDLGTFTLGFPETHAKAANNARVLRERAIWMSALAEEIAAPRITAQPQAAAVESGRTLTLQVGASGGGLAYQWYRDGSAVAGATSATFSKTAATGDAGSYTVQVSNLKGAATSESAAVTVTASTTPTPAPIPNVSVNVSVGRGGGGAPSDWAGGALALLLLARTLPRRRAA